MDMHQEESKLQAVEMKFLSAIVEKTRRERIKITYIRGRAQNGGNTEPNQVK
jgi:hypothetical protein